MQGGVAALDFFEDAGSDRGPDEGFGMLVVLSDVLVNGGDEKLSHLARRETFGMLRGDLYSPAVSLDPTRSLSESSCVGQL